MTSSPLIRPDFEKFEKIPTKVFESAKIASIYAAKEIADLIKEKDKKVSKQC